MHAIGGNQQPVRDGEGRDVRRAVPDEHREEFVVAERLRASALELPRGRSCVARSFMLLAFSPTLYWRS
jgi:hypothetical protein